MATSNDFQPRAKTGGEFGPNGEWYTGGQFIANSEDTIKGGNLAWDAPKPSAERLALDFQTARKASQYAAVLRFRVSVFADLLTVLESEPQGVYETFWQSLARQVRQTGSLSPKQAECAAKAVYGRRTKKNEEAYWTLVEDLKGAH